MSLYNSSANARSKRKMLLKQNNMNDESLLSLISLSFCTHLDGHLVLNYLLLVHFPRLGFIESLFQFLSNLALIGLIFVSNFFKYFVKQNLELGC